jgi:tartrate dehydratase beta subunit/fumarate hydratase class I family protein
MAQLAKAILLPAQHQEQLIFVDAFGKRVDVYLSLSAGPTRADKITSTVDSLNAMEATITAYAAANGHDLTEDLAAGAAAVAAFKAAK